MSKEQKLILASHESAVKRKSSSKQPSKQYKKFSSEFTERLVTKEEFDKGIAEAVDEGEKSEHEDDEFTIDELAYFA